MAHRHFILIDATLESQVTFFAQNPTFQYWLQAFSDVNEALQFINQITRPYSIEVYLARDNLLDNVLSADINGPPRTLIQTLNDLNTIHNVRVFCPTLDADSLRIILNATINPRLIGEVCSVIDLHALICNEGMTYFRQEITRCISQNEEHLISNLTENRNQLQTYLDKIIKDRQPIIDNLVEAHSNKPGEEAS